MLTLQNKELKNISINVAKNIDYATDEKLIELKILDKNKLFNPYQIIGISYDKNKSPNGCLLRLIETKELFVITTNSSLLIRML